MIFKTLTQFEAALNVFLKAIVPIDDTEGAPIREARGRVLARQIIAERNEPNYRRAATDGYAVVADDRLGAS
jgi:molybdopterin molybdotransferase